MSDLHAQIRTYVEDTIERIDSDDVVAAVASQSVVTDRAGRHIRPVWVAVGAALLVLIAVGLPLLLLGGGESIVADQPPSTVLVTADDPRPSEDVDLVTQTQLDYSSLGEPVSTLETPFGTLAWFQMSSVPPELYGIGFREASGPEPDHDLRRAFSKAPCCLEVFEGADGYLGLGSTGGLDEPRVIHGYMGNLFRARGVATTEEFETLFHTSGIEGLEIWGGGRWELYDDGSEFSFAPTEAWFSTDGSGWEQRAVYPLGTDVAMLSQPDSVVEQDGTWMVLGWSSIEDAADVPNPSYAHGARSAAWMSEDLETWTLVPFDFESPGVNTTLLSVVAGDGGWMIVGERTQLVNGLRESVVWISPDGLAWSELPMGEVVGLPRCGTHQQDETCLHGFLPALLPGGIALYAQHESPSGVGWRLWIGVWED